MDEERKINIFVVDASPVRRKLLINQLAAASDIAIAGEVGSGQEGLLLLDEVNPDVVLLNIDNHDHLSLSDVVKQLKAIKPEVGIVLCVDQTNIDEIMETVGLYECDFITRPYKRTSVLRVIRECVNKSSAL